MLKSMDGLQFTLKSDFDLNWLKIYGRIFCVFDQQDSGNICFGAVNDCQQTFIKVAGVSTMEYDGDLSEAVEGLKRALPIYRDIKHPNLVKLIEHFEINGGYAAVFEWADGECLHAHWDFEKYPKYIHPKSPNYKFRQLELRHKLDCLDDIFNFLEEVIQCGYVAIDFYDGSIMYDFDKNKTTICDIDFFAKTPYINTMGRMWGSTRFMSPEEYEMGAEIDEVTNVFTMGALAFELLGSNRERTLEKWVASENLYNIAIKAINPIRELRYQSIKEFHNEWKKILT